jgi:hypothetical protein
MPLDFVRSVNIVKSYKLPFIINPKQLENFSTVVDLDWKKVEFLTKNKTQIPKERGIYAFILEHNEKSKLPNHGYVLYVGISGDNSRYTLNARYGDYIRDKKEKKRPSIHYMLNNWKKCLYFHYAIVTDRRISLNKMEKDMSDALMPPFSKKDFSAEIRDITKAAF